MYLKNTAGQNIGFGLVDASTGAAITGASITAYRSIDGGGQAAVTGTITDKGCGQYNLALSQADTNGCCISLLFTATSAVPVEKTIITQPAPIAAGPHFADPRLLMAHRIGADSLCVFPLNGTEQVSTSAAFFTSFMAYNEMELDTDFSSGVYKTILNCTGRGIVYAVVGPKAQGAGVTTTFRITVDGTVSTIALTTAAGIRSVLGPLLCNATSGAYYTTAKLGVQTSYGNAPIDSGKALYASAAMVLPSINNLYAWGTPGLLYKESLLIEIMVNENNSATASEDRRTGVIHMVC